MTELMYEVPSDPTISKIVITEESVTEHKQPIVEHDEGRVAQSLPRVNAAAERALNHANSSNAS